MMMAMDSLAVGAVVLLAAVFAVAGVGKLLDLEGSKRALADFGVPSRAAPTLGLLLPLAELATAVLLVLHPTARVGAAIALALLAAFVGGIANVMRLGRAPACNCFGQIHSAPAGVRTLARNAALGAVAAFVVVRGPGPAIDAWISARTPAELVAIGTTLAALTLAVYSWWLWRQNRAHRETITKLRAGQTEELQIEGLATGTPAPSFALPTDEGEVVTLGTLLGRGRPVALFFMDATCGPCKGLMPELARWQEMLSDRITISVITAGKPKASASTWQEHSIADVLYDPDRQVFKAFNLLSTPTAMLISPEGLISGGPAGGLHMPEVLLRVAIRRAEGPDWPQRSHPAVNEQADAMPAASTSSR